MRNLFLSIAIFATVGVLAQTNTQSVDDNTMENIQQKIEKAFGTAFQQQSTAELEGLQSKLTEIYKKKPQNIVLYWKAYAQYFTAIYYIATKDKEQSEKEIDKAVEIMEEIDNKTSEDYALLALCQGFAIQFKNMLAMMSLSSKIENNAKEAINKDEENIRGYYSYASSDFYKPAKYGGGKKVEEYLLKAISLPAQKMKNPYLPSWGKQESYEMLVKWYIRKKDYKKAKLYYDEACSKYPNNYSMKYLEKQINDLK